METPQPYQTLWETLTQSAEIALWWDEQTLHDAAFFLPDAARWGELLSHANQQHIGATRWEKAVRACLAGNGTRPPPGMREAPEHPWRALLLLSKEGARANIPNISLILSHHPHWQERFWWDDMTMTPMFDTRPLTDDDITRCAVWLGTAERMPVSSWKMVERCILAQCRATRKDPLQHWLYSLPPWDQVERLPYWLSDATEAEGSAYGRAVSRILPLSMVARALDPGCPYRYVVILEGPENTGKSTLVRTLASPEWFVELSLALESKEAHMMLQGVWVAEMSELDSLSRTEETRLRAFVTMREDSYVPKYSNYRVTTLRRAILVGTTNETAYLKGQTGNTRFLPIRTHRIDPAILEQSREQLFAEALYTYLANPHTWWEMDEDALSQAKEEREKRRLVSVYESELADWLSHPVHQSMTSITWKELAEGFLKLDAPERWKDVFLQKQMAQALRALGWESRVKRDLDGKVVRKWWKEESL
jgi:putative DNA primase/helicase